jgi:predicted DNA-binding transcriptional regulator AlpA
MHPARLKDNTMPITLCTTYGTHEAIPGDRRCARCAALVDAVDVEQPPRAARLLTIVDVERRLRLSQRTIFRRVKDGTIPCLRIAGALRFREGDIADVEQQAEVRREG